MHLKKKAGLKDGNEMDRRAGGLANRLLCTNFTASILLAYEDNAAPVVCMELAC